MPRGSFDVFISYSSRDRPFVRQVVLALEGLGLEVWWDQRQDERGLVAGDPLVDTLGQALHEARFVLAFVSRSYLRSRWATTELREAVTLSIDRGAPTVLVVKPKNVELPAMLLGGKFIPWTSASVVAQEVGATLGRVAPEDGTPLSWREQERSMTRAAVEHVMVHGRSVVRDGDAEGQLLFEAELGRRFVIGINARFLWDRGLVAELRSNLRLAEMRSRKIALLEEDIERMVGEPRAQAIIVKEDTERQLEGNWQTIYEQVDVLCPHLLEQRVRRSTSVGRQAETSVEPTNTDPASPHRPAPPGPGPDPDP